MLVKEALQNDMKRFPEKYKKVESYYEILGVSNVADAAEIKAKYRELSMLYHPDKNPDPTAAEKFIKIKEAYEELSDPLKRSAYDEKLKKK
jgi:curved DNA-binding protein CbpA